MIQRTAFLMVFLLVASALGPGQAIGQTLNPDEKTERELRALRQEFLEAMKRGDRAVLERTLAEGFTFVHSTGVLETRKEFIDRTVASAKASPPGDLQFLEDHLRLYGDHTAVWITRSSRRTQGGDAELNFRGTDVLVKTGGQWKWASVQSTKLPTRPKAAALVAGVARAVAGQYEISANRALRVTEEGGILRAEGTGIRRAELIPRSETEFVWFDPESNADARIVFIKGENGQVTHAVFRREGAEVWRAKKIK